MTLLDTGNNKFVFTRSKNRDSLYPLPEKCPCDEYEIYGCWWEKNGGGKPGNPSIFCGYRPNRICGDHEERAKMPLKPSGGSDIITIFDCIDLSLEDGYLHCMGEDCGGYDTCNRARERGYCQRGFPEGDIHL